MLLPFSRCTSRWGRRPVLLHRPDAAIPEDLPEHDEVLPVIRRAGSGSITCRAAQLSMTFGAESWTPAVPRSDALARRKPRATATGVPATRGRRNPHSSFGVP